MNLFCCKKQNNDWGNSGNFEEKWKYYWWVSPSNDVELCWLTNIFPVTLRSSNIEQVRSVPIGSDGPGPGAHFLSLFHRTEYPSIPLSNCGSLSLSLFIHANVFGTESMWTLNRGRIYVAFNRSALSLSISSPRGNQQQQRVPSEKKIKKTTCNFFNKKKKVFYSFNNNEN